VVAFPLLQSRLLGVSRGSAQSAPTLHDEVRAGTGVDDLAAESVKEEEARAHVWWREAYSRCHALSIRVLAGTIKNAPAGLARQQARRFRFRQHAPQLLGTIHEREMPQVFVPARQNIECDEHGRAPAIQQVVELGRALAVSGGITCVRSGGGSVWPLSARQEPNTALQTGHCRNLELRRVVRIFWPFVS